MKSVGGNNRGQMSTLFGSESSKSVNRFNVSVLRNPGAKPESVKSTV